MARDGDRAWRSRGTGGCSRDASLPPVSSFEFQVASADEQLALGIWSKAVRSVGAPQLTCVLDSGRMSGEPQNARMVAEERYYSALDHYAEGRLAEAIADYEAAISTDPTFLDAMHGLARALQDASRYDEAIAVARQIAEIDPDDVLAHTSLSILYQLKGMVPEAEAEAAKARVLGWKQQLKQSTSRQP